VLLVNGLDHEQPQRYIEYTNLEDGIVDINALHQATLSEGKEAEGRLFTYLSVRFRVIAYLKVGNKQDAEDIVQEALAAIAEEYKTIQFRTSFAAWAYKVFDNRLLSYIGRKKQHSGTVVESLSDGHHSLDVLSPDPEFERQLSGCLEKLKVVNARYARVLELHSQGYGTSEVCRELGVTSGNLYMILFRARAMLKRCLETGDVQS
jgi:RNA polymerase sigma-70 factor (ECF subfamily)